MVRELLAAEKRISSFVAFVPFVGPWLIQRSDAHTDSEKRRLTWLSIIVSTAGAAALIAMIPNADDTVSRLQQRIESQMTALGAFAEQYRSEHGRYPEPTMWRRFADRADPRFYDPWGRPYRYEPSGGGFTLRTLGRDGVDGGNAEDADVSLTFPQPARR